MRRIQAGQARVGDVVAEPITNGQGRTLLPRGARLSAAVLSRLQGWGVQELCVEGEEPVAVGEAAAAGAGTRLLHDLDHRFAEWEGDEVMMRIKAVARRHLAGA